MSQSSDYNLLIQGPILSPGRTGTTFFNNELSESSIVYYQSEQNILALLNDFSYLFRSIAVITWDNETLDEALIRKFENVQIIKLQNITPSIRIDNRKLPTDFNNKFKQFYALAKGSELFMNNEAAFTIKIRTDQYVPLDKMIREHRNAIETNAHNLTRIFIPYINKKKYLPSDFYFAAKKSIFHEFVTAMLWNNYLEFNSSVHIDMSLKYAYLYHRKKINLPDRIYFLNSFDKNINRDKVILQNYLNENVFALFSFSLLENTTWRGDRISLDEKATESFAFSDKNSVMLLDPGRYKSSGLLDLIYTNIPSLVVVKLPSLRNTWVESAIRKLHSIFVNVFKK